MKQPQTVKAYPLSWPIGWPRATSRKRAEFGKMRERGQGGAVQWKVRERLEVGDGLDRLRTELRRLGARTVTISSNLQLRQDGLPIAGQAKVLSDPGVAVYFTLSEGKPLVLACDKWNSAADNMAAIAGHIEAIRLQERYGVGSVAQAFAGYLALPAKGETQGGDWRNEFGLDERHHFTLTDVEDIYRRLLRERHPDKGGSHDAVVRLNLARDAARAYFAADSHGG